MLRKTFPQARGRWTLDSGGFSELSLYGAWVTTPRDYVRDVRRYQDEIGGMDWAAIQDWMCEPMILQHTGLSVVEHQERTIESCLDLRDRAPEIPWLPVLQGWEQDDYHRHLDMYTDAGIDLTTFPSVGIGSVCRRQGSQEIDTIVRSLAVKGIRLHGFGVKTNGLRLTGDAFVSADSMAWASRARQGRIRLPGCTAHVNCAACLPWALEWRRRLLRSLVKPAVRRVKA